MKNILFLVFTTILFFSNNSCKSSSDDTITPEEKKISEFKSVVEEHGQLRVKGTTIVDENDAIVQLRGMSFFWSQWMGKYYTKEVVKWLKEDWQCTVVRASLAVDESDGYIDNPDVEKKKIFTVIDAAIAEGLYVIVDWHSHHAEDYITETKAFFSEVAQKYGNTPNIIYETYNEPLDLAWNTVLKPYHEEIIAAIREYDSDNIIICGTRTWSQRVDEVIGNPINDANVAYTLHYYASSHKQELRDVAQEAIANGIPLFVTEYGVTEYSGDGFIDVTEANLWWDFLDKNNISWCNWSLADKEETSAALMTNASNLGGWPTSNLTQSGKMVRTEIKRKNPKYEE
ncbi:MAG: glycoside hydrolase family 5 protein [Cellulophaga sp.]